jgi:hypothetical protein
MKCAICNHERKYHFSKGSNGSGCVSCLKLNPSGDICYCFEPVVLVMKKGMTKEQLDAFKKNWLAQLRGEVPTQKIELLERGLNK